MLSRVADSVFWMSRYIERAENVARFIDVNFHLILEGGSGKGEQWQPLIDVTGEHVDFKARFGKATRDNVIQFLTFDEKNANSIYSCVRNARENARTVRDVISSDTWEQINSFYLMLTDPTAPQKAGESPYDFFSQMRMASHLVVGVTDSTMSHGEAWNFCRLGRYLERTDAISRIIDVKYYLLKTARGAESAAQENIQWSAVLRSASGLEMYRKKHRRVAPETVVEFMLLDREFPRSALHCLGEADVALHAITGAPAGSYSCPAEQLMGRLYSDLSYATLQEILADDVHEYVDSLQLRLNDIGEAIFETFFSMKTAPK